MASCFMLQNSVCDSEKNGCADLLAHAQHSINFLDTKPVKNVRHKRLEAHVFHASNVFCSHEIVRGLVFATFAGIVDD